MIEPTMMPYNGYWDRISKRTFVDSGKYSNKVSIIEKGSFIIEVARYAKDGRFLNGMVAGLPEILDFLRESDNQLDRDVFEWFLFHIDEFI